MASEWPLHVVRGVSMELPSIDRGTINKLIGCLQAVQKHFAIKLVEEVRRLRRELRRSNKANERLSKGLQSRRCQTITKDWKAYRVGCHEEKTERDNLTEAGWDLIASHSNGRVGDDCIYTFIYKIYV